MFDSPLANGRYACSGNRKIQDNLHDGLPFPYPVALAFIRATRSADPHAAYRKENLHARTNCRAITSARLTGG